MAKKINMNAQEIAHFMRTRCNNLGESLMKRTVVVRQIKCFPKNSNQCRKAFILYNNLGNILDVIETIAANPATLRQELPKRITVIEDIGYISTKDFKDILKAYKMDW